MRLRRLNRCERQKPTVNACDANRQGNGKDKDEEEDKAMNRLNRSTLPLLCAALLLGGCSAMGWGQKSSGSTHTMTGGAEAAPTAESTPQPARPRGDTQRSSGGMTGQGDAATGGAEGAPTVPEKGGMPARP
jgi:hypothetical protein